MPLLYMREKQFSGRSIDEMAEAGNQNLHEHTAHDVDT
jgi:hypothetical protein